MVSNRGGLKNKFGCSTVDCPKIWMWINKSFNVTKKYEHNASTCLLCDLIIYLSSVKVIQSCQNENGFTFLLSIVWWLKLKELINIHVINAHFVYFTDLYTITTVVYWVHWIATVATESTGQAQYWDAKYCLRVGVSCFNGFTPEFMGI